MRLYLDANSIIYGIEGEPSFREAALGWINQAKAAPTGVVFTSPLSKLECRSRPLADANRALLDRYDVFFGLVKLGEVDETLVEQATGLRARLRCAAWMRSIWQRRSARRLTCS